ncbi:MAG TPA: glycosyltransferase family 2 protein [Pirellulales bacterium]|nr:glycosyltransferase family 2 protein [Pirellulales bacterium]
MTRPWLSVIMPTFNRAGFVDQALESVARQDDGTIEVIAVDDGSTDATPAMLAAYARRLRMTVIERRHSGNWVESTVLGMSAARGEYVCWLLVTRQQADLLQGHQSAGAGAVGLGRCRRSRATNSSPLFRHEPVSQVRLAPLREPTGVLHAARADWCSACRTGRAA